jgi:hypothetical protein
MFRVFDDMLLRRIRLSRETDLSRETGDETQEVARAA